MATDSVLVWMTGTQAEALRIWPLVRDGVPAAQLLRDLLLESAAGSSGQPDCAVVIAEPGSARIVVRGDLRVIAEPAVGAGAVEVSGAGLVTWAERIVPGVQRVSLGALADGVDALLPMPVGVVCASAVRWQLPATAAEVAIELAEPVDNVVSLVAEDPAPAKPRYRYRHRLVEDTSDLTGTAMLRYDPYTESGREPAVSDQDDAVEGSAAQAISPPVELPAKAGPDVQGDDDSVTVISIVPALSKPAVPGPPVPLPELARGPESVGALEHSTGNRDQTVFPDDSRNYTGIADLDSAAENLAADGGAAENLAADGGAAENLAADGGAAENPAVAGCGADDDAEGHTVLAGDVAKLIAPQGTSSDRPAAAADEQRDSEDRVLASLCPAGHANAPHSAQCRVCAAAVAAAEPVWTQRPVLGQIRVSTGSVVDIDSRVVIGRAPSAARTPSAQAAGNGTIADRAEPRLITVPSPNQDISRSHVEVRAEDWHLVVADLHSTNGTMVRAPHRADQLLRPGQHLVVETGWTVDLGDGISFVVEATG